MDLHIQSLRVTHHNGPKFDTPAYDSTLGPFEDFSPSVLRVRLGDGREGNALTTYIEGRVIRTVLAPIVLGRSVRDWPELRERCFWAIRNLGHAGLAMNALSSLDIAAHDLLGQLAGEPLWHTGGDRRSRVEAYGSGGWVNLKNDQLVSFMNGLVQRGFKTVKMKIGVDQGCSPDKDIERVKIVRDAIGHDVALAVDANQCWDASTAIRVAKAIADYNIAWFEEPVFAWDRQAAAVFKRQSPIPLASGESERLPVGFRELIAMDAVDIVQPQPLCCGGVTGWREVATIAGGAGLPIYGGGPSFLTCQLLATAPGAVLCEYLVPHMDALTQYYKEKPALDGSMFLLKESPGHGLRLDDEYLRTHPGAAGWERSQ